LQDEGALVVPPAFAAQSGLSNALTGIPGSLTIESLRERLTYCGRWSGFYRLICCLSPAGSSLSDVAITWLHADLFRLYGGIIPELQAESTPALASCLFKDNGINCDRLTAGQ